MQSVAEGSWVGDTLDDCRGTSYSGLSLRSPFLLLASHLILCGYNSALMAALGTLPEVGLTLPKTLAAPALVPLRFDPKDMFHRDTSEVPILHILLLGDPTQVPLEPCSLTHY